MTREDIFDLCLEKIDKEGSNNCLLMELATGFGKSKLSIDLVNHLVTNYYQGKKTKMLLLVAKTVHKQTWKDEFKKWGGINVDRVIIECYESLRKHTGETFDFIVADEVHHIKSETRLDLLSTLKYSYMIGLSATIPKKLKQYFRFHYSASIVSCDITEAIESDVLPEPEILLFPLHLNNIINSETIEINPKVKGRIYYGTYKDLRMYKSRKVHAILQCTQKQKMIEMNKLIDWYKNTYMRKRSKILENLWLHECGKRLEFLSYCKNDLVLSILKKLQRYRTITFCKTIEQCELLGKNCIHSKNNKATDVYDRFNQRKLNHITAVNILNENANLVDCKYAIFANLSSSDVIIPQRLGRSMRHKKPVIIVPYYVNTREEEIVKKMFKDYDRRFLRTIYSVDEVV